MPETANAFGLILSGGMALGAYHAGVYQTLRQRREPDWLAGSSIGAITAALIAGTAPQARIDTLERFWRIGPTEGTAFIPWLHFANWANALGARLLGVPGLFRPRLNLPAAPFVSLYDLSPMRERLERLVDFERLNNGNIRLSIATTDIETGELVIFDTGKGDRIESDHLLASCGLLPEFAPVRIGPRLLGDGGLSANAPLEALLDASGAPSDCFIVDLYARDGARPSTLEGAFARRSDLMFANQTWQRLEAWSRRVDPHRSVRRVMYLSYRASAEEAGPEKIFDHAPRSVAMRWRAGKRDAALALEQLGTAPSPALVAIRAPD